MHTKIHEKVDLFADMLTPLPSHPHDVKFRGIVFNALTSKNIQRKKRKRSTISYISVCNNNNVNQLKGE
jgi:hypothetical protein